jgi:hypothetical protein
VWLDPDFTQVGLAMARSIGDRAVKGVGVIAEPEVLMHDFTVRRHTEQRTRERGDAMDVLVSRRSLSSDDKLSRLL